MTHPNTGRWNPKPMPGMKNGIYKRGNSWYFQVKVNGLTHRRSCGPDKRLAEAMHAEFVRQRATGRLTNNFSGLEHLLKPKCTETFAQSLEAYLSERQLKHSTKLAYEERSRHLLPEFGQKRLGDISEEQIARFQARLVAKQLSSSRINAVLNLLRTVLATAERRGLIETNPANGVKRMRTELTEVDPLTMDELHLALSKLSSLFRPLFTVLAWTGARPGELKALRWCDLDFNRNEIRINKARYKGVESTTKTKASSRTIPMLKPVRECLLDLKRNTNVADVEGHVFVGREGKTIERHLDRTWAVALTKAGLRHRPSYQLRHTFASLLLQAGEEPGMVSKMLGHTNLQTTFRHYARFIDTKKDPRQRIDKALFPTVESGTQKGTQLPPTASLPGTETLTEARS